MQYNGCTWKGGKLKLERAKESYLDRLKREWAEDAKLASERPIDTKIEKDLGSSKLQRLNLESVQLQIFFPKLRKVRSASLFLITLKRWGKSQCQYILLYESGDLTASSLWGLYGSLAMGLLFIMTEKLPLVMNEYSIFR